MWLPFGRHAPTEGTQLASRCPKVGAWSFVRSHCERGLDLPVPRRVPRAANEGKTPPLRRPIALDSTRLTYGNAAAHQGDKSPRNRLGFPLANLLSRGAGTDRCRYTTTVEGPSFGPPGAPTFLVRRLERFAEAWPAPRGSLAFVRRFAGNPPIRRRTKQRPFVQRIKRFCSAGSSVQFIHLLWITRHAGISLLLVHATSRARTEPRAPWRRVH